jgi:hypothetical protein
MNFNTVDLEKELDRLKEKDKKKAVLSEVDDILQQAEREDLRVSASLSGEQKTTFINESLLDDSRIYSYEQIKEICIKYRLRFLDSKVFKGEIPYEAISKIKQLEREQNQTLNGFKIVAPKELFQLEDKDSDPLLFLPLKNGRYYLIHKWGGELNVFRSILAFPLRNFMSMFWFLVGVAIVFSLAVPTPSWHVFLFLVVHSFIAICGITCMLVFMARENFSSTEWDSKYLS